MPEVTRADVCAAAGIVGDASTECAADPDAETGLADVDVCLAAGLTGDATGKRVRDLPVTLDKLL